MRLRQRRDLLLMLGVLAFGTVPRPAVAQETTTYTYDAQGRVRAVTRSGGQNNGVVTTYNYDKAGNRTNVKTAGSQNGTGGSGSGATVGQPVFVFVPLAGISLVTYPN